MCSVNWLDLADVHPSSLQNSTKPKYWLFSVFITSQITPFTWSKIASVAHEQIMRDLIPDIAVVLPLLLEALSLLDRPEYARASAHLQDAIAELSHQKRDEPFDGPPYA